MKTFLIRELLGQELQTISTYRSCRTIQDGIVIEPNGKLTFDLSSYPGGNLLSIRAKRISGNGKITIDSIEKNIYSKISETIDIPINSYKIELTRSKAMGEICILEATICLQEESESVADTKWKSIIAKCEKYYCLQLVGSKLFAASGAFIETKSNDFEIETNPPNMFRPKNNKIEFLGPCEITKLIITNSEKTSSTSLNIFNTIDAPIPIVAPDPLPIAAVSYRINKNDKIPSLSPSTPLINKTNMFIYDSNLVHEFNVMKPKGKNYNHIKSNGHTYLVVMKGGTYQINLSDISMNTDYMVTIYGKKLNGNGKLTIKVTDPENGALLFSNQIIIEGNVENTLVKVNSGSIIGPRILNISMGDDSSGEVLISRILVSLYDDSYKEIKENQISYYIKMASGHKRFVIVVPSYNNERWCERNVQSILTQHYDKFRAIIINDASTDRTLEKIQNIVNQSSKKNKITIISNSERKGALANLYSAIHSCDDDEIVLTLDGDDWFPHEVVVSKLESIYSKEDVWMTYGQYQNYPDGGRGVAQPYAKNIVESNSFRNAVWGASHLRTFYAWLFKSIKKDDLFYKGNFLPMTWDLAMMFPMLEMAGRRSKFLPDILYTYNLENPINDHKVDVRLQQELDHYIRKLPRYSNVSTPITHKKCTIGLMIIATGKYDKYIQGLVSSADNYFLKSIGCEVTYYVFSDKPPTVTSNRKVIHLPIEHKPFPHASMDRFKHFANFASQLSNEDYLYYVDVDCLFVDHISSEIFGSLVGVRHCGYINMTGPYEDNPNSAIYVDSSYARKYKYYYGGGFSGGRRNSYLTLARCCDEIIDRDLANGIVPRWHDESAINWYFLDNEPDVILTPSYHYPESNIEYYKKIWQPQTYKAKILLLDKNHVEIRT